MCTDHPLLSNTIRILRSFLFHFYFQKNHLKMFIVLVWSGFYLLSIVSKKHPQNTKDYAFNLMFVWTPPPPPPIPCANSNAWSSSQSIVSRVFFSHAGQLNDDKQYRTFFPDYLLHSIRKFISIGSYATTVFSLGPYPSVWVYLINSKCFSLLSFVVLYLKFYLEW